MTRLVIGSLIAAVAMFLLGFAFYASPLQSAGFATPTNAQSDAVQAALAGLPSGTYVMPGGADMAATEAAFAKGPVALVKLHAGGTPMFDPMVLLAGYAHMAISALLLGLVLWTIRDKVRDFPTRLRVVAGSALVMVVFIRLGEPIWWHTDWRNAAYVAVADWLSLTVAGWILARWFLSPRAG
jgi:hypothetical protein